MIVQALSTLKSEHSDVSAQMKQDAVHGLNLQLPSALTAILTARRPEAALALAPSGEVMPAVIQGCIETVAQEPSWLAS